MIKLYLAVITMILSLSACVYIQTPNGQMAIMNLPVRQESVIHKTVTVYAPEGTTVILQETPPPPIFIVD